MSNITSVSPILETDGIAKEELGDDDDSEEEAIPTELEGEVAERIGPEKEGTFIKKLIDPKLPTKEEVEMHNLMGHVEYRNWCEICVRCQGREMDHRNMKGKERKFPEYSFDYCFPGDEVGFKWTVLVLSLIHISEPTRPY